MFKQTLRDVESMFEDIGGYDITFCEFTQMCRESWSERFKYLCTDMSINKNEGKYRLLNESQNIYIGWCPEMAVF